MRAMASSNAAYRLAPWTSVVQPHDDILGGALDMGTYAVNLARIYRGAAGVSPVYATPGRFFAATHLTTGMRALLVDVFGALADGKGDRVLQLRTPFGGGKTHTLAGLLHLAKDRAASVSVMPELGEVPDPGEVAVSVLSGEELDPLSPLGWPDGTQTKTLWGEFAQQLGRYELMRQHDDEGSAPGGDVIMRVIGSEPTLILLDEVLVYVEKAQALVRGESTLGRQAMLFLQGLTEAVNSLPNAVMVYSLQASVGEAVGAEGLLTQLDHLVSRIDAKREPVSGDEVMRVIQRRLFADIGDEAIRGEVARSCADLVRRQLQAQAETDDARREADVEATQLEARIIDAYPIHPALLDLMYYRWGSLPSYQRTRGALQFLASATHALWGVGSASPLIGPGDVDFADEATRGSFFSQVGERERYTAVLDGDVVADGSGAKVVDRRVGADAPGLAQLDVGTRMATAIMLYSFGAREGEDRGVLESDLVAATLVPGLDRNVIVAGLHDLREEELYLHYTGRRYRFEPVPNLTKLVRDEANKFSPDEVLAEIRKRLEGQLRDARNVVVWPDGPGSIRDGVPAFTLAYLHPDWEANEQPLANFVEEVRGGKRQYRNGIGMVIPDASQFDRARAAARLRLATEALLARRNAQGFTVEQVEELKEKSRNSENDLDATLGNSYARVAVPVRGEDGQGAYAIEEIDLRSLLSHGRGLNDRVLEALSHRVFHNVTVDKLVALSGLGPEKPHVRCDELVTWFFSYFDFTKLTSSAAIADAIARGVADRRFAYVTGLEIDGAGARVRDPQLVRDSGMLPFDEIDLGAGAYLITPEFASSLKPDSGEPGETPAVSPVSTREGEDIVETPAPAPDESITHVALRLRLGKDGLLALNRSLSWLRERSVDLDVEVTARASADEAGFDQVAFRNGVVEPLEEGGVEIVQRNLS
jgi:hypothetical protein